MTKFTLKFVDQIESRLDDAVDVEIILEDGARYAPTFFTLTRIARIMQKFQQEGAEAGAEADCANGAYFWAHDMVIVKEMTPEVIEATIRHLLEDHKSLDKIFERMSDYPGEDGQEELVDGNPG